MRRPSQLVVAGAGGLIVLAALWVPTHVSFVGLGDPGAPQFWWLPDGYDWAWNVGPDPPAPVMSPSIIVPTIDRSVVWPVLASELALIALVAVGLLVWLGRQDRRRAPTG